jgi:hypothetical protein
MLTLKVEDETATQLSPCIKIISSYVVFPTKHNSICFLSTLTQKFPSSATKFSLSNHGWTHDYHWWAPTPQSRMLEHRQLGMTGHSGASVHVLFGECRQASEQQRNNATCIFIWKSPYLRDRVSDAVERTSDIALQIKTILFTERLRFDLRRSMDLSFRGELQSFTSTYHLVWFTSMYVGMAIVGTV